MDTKDYLSSIPFFHEFSSRDLEIIGGVFKARNYLEADIIFRRLEEGQEIYFIKQGRVDVIWEMSQIRRLILASIESGSFFGEMSLLEHRSRSATVMAVENCELFSLGRQDFFKIINRHPMTGNVLLKGIGRGLGRRLRLLNEHLLFTEATLKMLDEKNRAGKCTDLSCEPDILIKRSINQETFDFLKICGETKTVEAGEIIISEGDNHSEFYLIQEGTAEVNKLMPNDERIVLTILGPGNICGEMAFLDSEYRSAEVRAREPMSMCVYRKEHLLKLAQMDMPLVNNIYLTVLRHISMNIRLTNEHYIASKRILLGLT